jgi:hypothetical protein
MSPVKAKGSSDKLTRDRGQALSDSCMKAFTFDQEPLKVMVTVRAVSPYAANYSIADRSCYFVRNFLCAARTNPQDVLNQWLRPPVAAVVFAT